MKDITAAVIAKLQGDSTLGTYTGANPNQRIYRATLPIQPTWPCIVVQLIDTKRLTPDHISRIAQSRIQVTVFATTDASGNEISERVAEVLHRADHIHLGTGVHAIRIDDGGVRTDANPQFGKFLYHRDFLIQHYY